MATVSVVISAFNEEAKIERCLEALSWADEIIVVDSGSTDKTAPLAKKYTKKVLHRPNNAMLNVNKNFGFEKATSEWILSLDADEVVPAELAHEIQSAVKNDGPVGFWIPRKNMIFGKWIQHGLWWPDKQLRLFKKGHGKFPEKHVHEYIAVDGRVDDLTTPYIHYNYETVSQFLRKMDTIYTESEVKNHEAAGYQLAWYDAVRFPISDFVKVFFAQGGYKDGLHGLVLSILQAFYSFIVFAKLWEREQFKQKDVTLSAFHQEFHRASADVGYWDRTARMKETKNPIERLFLKFQRKFFV